jgi:hypothetical protein
MRDQVDPAGKRAPFYSLLPGLGKRAAIGWFRGTAAVPHPLGRALERNEIRLGPLTTEHFFSRPGHSSTSAASRGPFYFAWGCFRDFVSSPAVHRP